MPKEKSFSQHFNKTNLSTTLAVIICFSVAALGCKYIVSNSFNASQKWPIISIVYVVFWLLAGIGLTRKSAWGWWLASILQMLYISSNIGIYSVTKLMNQYVIFNNFKMFDISSYYIFYDPLLYISVLLVTLLLLRSTRQHILPKPIDLPKPLVVFVLIFCVITGFITIPLWLPNSFHTKFL